MFAKVVLDGRIIDVFSEYNCCKYDKRSGMVLRCGVGDNPSGIISERTGEIYQVDGWPLFPDDNRSAGTVKIDYIEADEYEALVDALNADGPVIQPSEDPEIPPDATVEFVKDAVIKQMSTACNATITNGIEVVLSDGQSCHYSLGLEDQLNLLSLQGMLAAGAEAVPYHADGEECRYYSAADFGAIAQAATAWKLYQESYFNSLRGYIRSMETMAELRAVTYGMEIPEEYQTDVLKGLRVQMGGG